MTITPEMRRLAVNIRYEAARLTESPSTHEERQRELAKSAVKLSEAILSAPEAKPQEAGGEVGAEIADKLYLAIFYDTAAPRYKVNCRGFREHGKRKILEFVDRYLCTPRPIHQPAAVEGHVKNIRLALRLADAEFSNQIMRDGARGCESSKQMNQDSLAAVKIAMAAVAALAHPAAPVDSSDPFPEPSPNQIMAHEERFRNILSDPKK